VARVLGRALERSYLRKIQPLEWGSPRSFWVTGLPKDTHPSSAAAESQEGLAPHFDTIWSLISLSKSRHMFYDMLMMPLILQGCRVPNVKERTYGTLTYVVPLIEM